MINSQARASKFELCRAAGVFGPKVSGMRKFPGFAVSVMILQLWSAQSRADDTSIVRQFERGFHLILMPSVLFPTGGGKTGFGLGLEARYGIDLGSVIVAPGAMFTSYFGDRNVYLGAGIVRLTFPVGRFGPYVEGGLGVGTVSNPSQTGALLMAGAGFMVYLGDRFGLGLSGDYEKITGTDFGAVILGPGILLAF